MFIIFTLLSWCFITTRSKGAIRFLLYVTFLFWSTEFCLKKPFRKKEWIDSSNKVTLYLSLWITGIIAFADIASILILLVAIGTLLRFPMAIYWRTRLTRWFWLARCVGVYEEQRIVSIHDSSCSQIRTHIPSRRERQQQGGLKNESEPFDWFENLCMSFE